MRARYVACGLTPRPAPPSCRPFGPSRPPQPPWAPAVNRAFAPSKHRQSCFCGQTKWRRHSRCALPAPASWTVRTCSKRGRHGGRPPGVRTTRVTRALLLPLEDELALGALPILAAQARAVAKADRGDLLGTCLCTGDIDWIDCCASSSRPPASMCARCSIRMCRWRSRTPARALVGSPRLQPRTRAPGVATPQGRPPCPRTGG